MRKKFQGLFILILVLILLAVPVTGVSIGNDPKGIHAIIDPLYVPLASGGTLQNPELLNSIPINPRKCLVDGVFSGTVTIKYTDDMGTTVTEKDPLSGSFVGEGTISFQDNTITGEAAGTATGYVGDDAYTMSWSATGSATQRNSKVTGTITASSSLVTGTFKGTGNIVGGDSITGTVKVARHYTVQGADVTIDAVISGRVVFCDYSISDQIQIQRCYGGVGRQCEGLPKPWSMLAPIKKDASKCSVQGWMSGGSILHDWCCLITENAGYSCLGLNTGDPNLCKTYWDEAWRDTSPPCTGLRQWSHTFDGPYVLDNTGDDTTQILKAPSGMRINPDFAQYVCPSGTCATISQDKCGLYCECQ